MARLPIRILGLLLLTVSISVASCQALFHSLAPLTASSADPAAISQPR